MSIDYRAYIKSPAWRKRASISAEKRTKPLGYFEDEVAAARAYNHEAILQFGEFARLNDV